MKGYKEIPLESVIQQIKDADEVRVMINFNQPVVGSVRITKKEALELAERHNRFDPFYIEHWHSVTESGPQKTDTIFWISSE